MGCKTPQNLAKGNDMRYTQDLGLPNMFFSLCDKNEQHANSTTKVQTCQQDC